MCVARGLISCGATVRNADFLFASRGAQLVNLVFDCGPFAYGYDRCERGAVMAAGGEQGTGLL